jgi:acyl carrier protein
MDRASLRGTLADLLRDNVGSGYENLSDSDDLRTGLGLDSVDLVTLVIEVQARFGVEIASAALAELKTVGDLLDLLEARLGARPQSSAA